LDTATIIAALEAQRDRLDQAIAALRGRQTKSLTLSGKPDGRKRKRHMSAARKRIGEAMKKNWAEKKKKVA
jgi:LPS sulfotransferase NodH